MVEFDTADVFGAIKDPNHPNAKELERVSTAYEDHFI